MPKKKKIDFSIVHSKTQQSTALQQNEDGTLNRPIDGFPVMLDQVDFFDLNPRNAENPEYDNIKESIRNTGLKNRLSVTKRPGEDKFILSDGGNTRLKILRKLYDETGDKKFYELSVDYTPFTSNSDLIIRHMVENEISGGTIFFDRANAAQQIRVEWEKENSGKSMSARKLVEVCKDQGWTKISLGTASLYTYCVDNLVNVIPKCLESGFGKSKILELRKFGTSITTYVDFMSSNGLDSESAFGIWYEVLKETDETPDLFNLSQCWHQFAVRLSELMDMSLSEVETQLNHILEHKVPNDGKIKYVEIPKEDEVPTERKPTPSTSTVNEEPQQPIEQVQVDAVAAKTPTSEPVESNPAPASVPEEITKAAPEKPLTTDRSQWIDAPFSKRVGKMTHARMIVSLHPIINTRYPKLYELIDLPDDAPMFAIREELLTDENLKQTMQWASDNLNVIESYIYYRLLVMWVAFKQNISGEYDRQTCLQKNLYNAISTFVELEARKVIAVGCTDMMNNHPNLEWLRKHGLRQFIDDTWMEIEENFEAMFIDFE